MKTVLVTTGATVTFTALLEHVLRPHFLQSLIGLQVSVLYIQYGNERNSSGVHVSREIFHRILAEHGVAKQFGLLLTTYGDFEEHNGRIKIIAFPFDTNLADYIERADLVVSHAGTGSILDVLRLNKKLVAVLNDLLMDNHQREIAHAFEAKGHLCAVSSTEMASDSDPLLAKVQGLLQGVCQLTPLESPPSSVLAGIIRYEMATC